MEGNQMKMREALNNIGNAAAWVAENCNDQQTATYMNDIIAMIQAALAAPPRNCDVGTADEQSERMEKTVCSRHHGCVRCPLRKVKYSDCSLGWAQTLYTEEGAK